MKNFTKLAVSGLLVALLAGCKTLPPEENYGRVFTGKVTSVNNRFGLARSQALIARDHIDMSKLDLLDVQIERGFTSNLYAGVLAPKSVHVQPGDFVEVQNGTKDRDYTILTRVIQRANESGPCKWTGSYWGRNAGVECK